ncbi:hypothetical protein VNI00_007335 [Paramarasmius palmivorus]|uniref:CxC2-like cysteine cluster KDZ transposase-associated domain-containing protein n=1 Tax=Paramarasmius palmivorus TaxID=297713 RepID=A0AAW0D2S2_9AGAR
MLKRGGRGNYSIIEVAETQPGELAIQCPACPRVGINIPSDWDKKKRQYLYTMFLAVDACFRLKRKLVSSEVADPGLGTGWSYMVEDEPYRAYLLEKTNEVEMSSCSGLAALDHANSRNARGNYATSGVALGCCARHEFIQPNGVGDLQRGERYCNMDWIIASLLRYHGKDLKICLSYDICCQYRKKFINRISQLPPHLEPAATRSYMFVIPKLHIYGHKLACQLSYSLNLTTGVGRTDGEGIERNWAGQGPIATSTMEMGPGSRHDTLDDQWACWNWRKLVGLGSLLQRRLRLAIDWRIKQKRFFDLFTKNQAVEVPGWKKMVKDYEADNNNPNPYTLPETTMKMQKVRAEILREDETLDRLGTPDKELTSMGPGAFLLFALDIEEKQRQIKQDLALRRTTPTSQQASDIVDRRARLRRLLSQFVAKQSAYMPIVGTLRLPDATSLPDVEILPLYLPSELSDEQLKLCPSGSRLNTIELRLRNAQCSESLEDVRNHLLIRTRLLSYKGAHARHQDRLTRANALIGANEKKVKLHARRYQEAWTAIRTLCRRDGQNHGWRELKYTDLRCMEDEEDGRTGVPRKKPGAKSSTSQRAQLIRQGPNEHEDEGETEKDKGDEDNFLKQDTPAAAMERWRKKRDTYVRLTGEGKRQMSWIWTAADPAGLLSDEALNNGLRVEWAKAYARLSRWEEESSWWEKRANTKDECKDAYAFRQASIYRSLANRFRKQWRYEMDDKDDDDSDSDQDETGEDDDDDDEEYYEDPTKEWNKRVEDTVEEVEEGDLEEHLSEQSEVFTDADDDDF